MVSFLDHEGTDPASAAREAAEAFTKARREVEAKGIRSFLFQASSPEEFDQRAGFGGVSEVLDGIANEYLGSPDQRAKLTAALRREFVAQDDPENDADETLGPCGCTNYHLADCPTRGGAAAESSYDDDPYDEPDDWRAYSKVAVGKSCPTCDKPVGELRDDASKREAAFSGLCNGCQDDYFGPEPPAPVIEKNASNQSGGSFGEEPVVEMATDKLPEWVRDSQVPLG